MLPTAVILGRVHPVWWVLTPALLLTAWFVGALIIYGVLSARRGVAPDAEVQQRGSSLLVGMWVRQWFAWTMEPVAGALRRARVPATAITTLSVLLAALAGVALASGRFALGGWLYIAAGICDFLDGRVARANGEASARGAALDSVLDRYCDAAVLVGLGWYYRSSPVLLVVLAALVGAMMVPYIRARGESLGVEMRVGLMQRAERIVLLAVPMVVSPIVEAVINPDDPAPPHWLVALGVLMLAVLSQVTAAGRLIHLLRSLERQPLGRPLASLRTAVTGFVAVAADLLLVLGLVEVAETDPWLATLTGALLAAALGFALRRAGATDSRTLRLRFAGVSITGAVLTAGGVALLTTAGLGWLTAWALTRLSVYLAWNRPLHRDYVFGKTVSP